MANFVMLMKDPRSDGDWDAYIETLAATGNFRGGSSLGNGVSVRKGEPDEGCTMTGMIRLEVNNLAEARALLAGNPAYESGYAIEILEEVFD